MPLPARRLNASVIMPVRPAASTCGRATAADFTRFACFKILGAQHFAACLCKPPVELASAVSRKRRTGCFLQPFFAHLNSWHRRPP